MKVLISKKFNYNMVILFILVGLSFSEKIQATQIITRITVNAKGIQGNSHSRAPRISADGRFIAFYSDANNLVENDFNNQTDIFVYDRILKRTDRVSVNSDGAEANFISFFPVISADGRYVVFQSDASNLMVNDSNYTTDIFLHDRHTGQTHLVSKNSQNKQSNSTSYEPTLSADGCYIAFHSKATNLVAQDTNRGLDVFVHDYCQTAQTTRVSQGHQGQQANSDSFGAAISADGHYIAFTSMADNLIVDNENNSLDKNDSADVFIRDQDTGEIWLISVNQKGEQGNADSYDASLSADGRYVAFLSKATNLVEEDTNEIEDIFVHDRETHETTLVTVNSEGQQANAESFGFSLSADGRYVAFNSEASNLVADDNNQTTDVFLHDRHTGQTQRLSLNGQYSPIFTASSAVPAISNDNRLVVFESKAYRLVANDSNKSTDIFLYDLGYYARYDGTTHQLSIPVLSVASKPLLEAHLSLISDQRPYQFKLESYSPLSIKLENIANSYQLDKHILHLPKVEALISGQLKLCEVEMVSDSELTIFTETQIVCSQK